MGVHVVLSSMKLLLGLQQDLADEILVLNNRLNMACSLLMSFDEVDNDIIRQREVVKEVRSEHPTDERYLREAAQERKEGVRDDIRHNEGPVFHGSMLVIESSVCGLDKDNNGLGAALTFFEELPVLALQNSQELVSQFDNDLINIDSARFHSSSQSHFRDLRHRVLSSRSLSYHRVGLVHGCHVYNTLSLLSLEGFSRDHLL
mmetsp:Transcript_29366/g.44327  ORF Transcript_29366/g.44327 Transcript_29366/m.44327 type:complete len:203 (-) Transcript_29366:2102-2710(-)